MSGVAQRAQMVDVLSVFKLSKKQPRHVAQAQQIVKRPSERKMHVQTDPFVLTFEQGMGKVTVHL